MSTAYTFVASAKYCFHFSVTWPDTQLLSFDFSLLGLTKILLTSLLLSRVNILPYTFLVSFAITYSVVSFSGCPAIWSSLHFHVFWILYILNIRFYTADLQNSENKVTPLPVTWALFGTWGILTSHKAKFQVYLRKITPEQYTKASILYP